MGSYAGLAALATVLGGSWVWSLTLGPVISRARRVRRLRGDLQVLELADEHRRAGAPTRYRPRSI